MKGSQDPVMWVCLLMPGQFPHPESEKEPRIRAWTTNADRAQRFQEVEGLDMQPLYADDTGLPDGRNRLVQQNSLLISQIANCNKEIKRLREALLRCGNGAEC